MGSTRFTTLAGDNSCPRWVRGHAHNLTALVCLVIYLLILVGGLQGFPLLLLLTMGHTHQMTLTKDHAQIHLVFHHAGEISWDAKPAGLPGSHKHDITDQPVFEDTSGKVPPADHETHLSDEKERISVATKSTLSLKSIPLMGMPQCQMVLPEPIIVHLLPPYLIKASPQLLSIRTTVLLI